MTPSINKKELKKEEREKKVMYMSVKCEACKKKDVVVKDYRERDGTMGSWKVCEECILLKDREFFHRVDREIKDIKEARMRNGESINAATTVRTDSAGWPL